MSEDYVIGTLFPQRFLPMLGYMAVQHAQMDHAVDQTIGTLLKVDPSAATAITSAVMNLSTRLDIMRRLIITTVSDPNDSDKLNAIRERIGELNSKRNRIMHDRQYFYSPSTDTVGYFRAENLTDPQIRMQPPTKVTIESLKEAGHEMLRTKVWLGMYLQVFPDISHPEWTDDDKFPWPDKLARLREKRSRKQD